MYVSYVRASNVDGHLYVTWLYLAYLFRRRETYYNVT